MKLKFIADHVGYYSLSELCEALEVAPSAYYVSQTRQPLARSVEDAMLKHKILEIHGRAGGHNRYRKHSSLGCRSPVEFEQQNFPMER